MSSKEGFRLSPQQRLLWWSLGELRDAAPAHFWARCLLSVRGAQTDRFEAALQALVDRHEALRTFFQRPPGMDLPVQIIGDGSAAAISHRDLRELSAKEQELAIEALFDAEAGVAPALSAGAAFTVLSVGPERHIVLVRIPALCADSVTLGNLAGELAKCLKADGAGELGADDVVQYADVAEVFNELLEAEDTEEGRAYWRRYEAAELGRGQLAFEHECTALPPYRPQCETWQVDPALWNDVAAVAASEGCPSWVPVLATWAALLHRIAEEPPQYLGVACAGRTYEGLDQALGLFLRYVPIEVSPQHDTPFARVVSRVARHVAEAGEWQDYLSPNILLAEELRLPFRFRHAEWTAPADDSGLQVALHKGRVYAGRCKIELCWIATENGHSVELHYDAAFYSAGDVKRLGEWFLQLLRQVCHQPGSPMLAFSILTEEDSRRMLSELHASAMPVEPRAVHQLFEEQARLTPDRAAVVFRETTLTYRSLNERANQLAHHLRSLGVGPDVRVGLLLERSENMLIALLGILKAGGAYVPLDPMYPAKRLGFLLDDARASVWIASGPSQVPTTAALVHLEQDADAIASQATSDPPVQTSPQHLAYIIYTSGSSGRPKGVMVTHDSVVNLAYALQSRVYSAAGSGGSPGAGLRVSLNAPLAFDSSVKQWIQLCFGHTMYIVPEEIRPDGARLRDFIRTQGLDVFDCTPSQLRLLLDAGFPSAADTKPTRVLIGGEAILRNTWKTLAEDSVRRFVNVYGPTEATVDATAAEIAASPEPTIGTQLANVRVYILDDFMQPVPRGIWGEIYIAGRGLARGYWARPSLTAERFLPDPFGPAGGRMYRTGDIARFLEDGSIAFRGRRDHQVKLRGFRIELGEIEAAIQEHPAVSRAVVVVRELEPGVEHLIAYVATRVPAGSNAAAIAAELREHARQFLPEYMVPGGVIVVDRIPLSQHGKVELEALPDPRQALQSQRAPYEAPQSEIEKRIAAIWQEVLKTQNVGLHDNFFDLGGHSLLMAEVHSKICAAFGARLSMVELFRHPTVSALATFLGESGAKADSLQSIDDRAQKQKQAMRRRTERMKKK